jgi:hypothetical protein
MTNITKYFFSRMSDWEGKMNVALETWSNESDRSYDFS